MSNSVQTALFISIPRAARRVGVGLKRMKAAVDAGQIPSIEIGKQKMVPRRALERLAGREVGDE